MGFRFRKSIQLVPGVRMTFSKSGVSYSVGGPGYRVTRTSTGRLTRTINIPGTGLSHTETIGGGRARPAGPRPIPEQAPLGPGLFAPQGEKALYTAVHTQNWPGVERVIREYPEYAVLAGALFGLWASTQPDPGRATELLSWVLDSGQDPAEHPFARKYLQGSFTLQLAPGVTVELPVSRDCVGLTLVELHQGDGDLAAAIGVVERLEPTTYAAVSLAELYCQAGRHADVIEITEGVRNVDDATALLCVLRGVAFREQGYHDAAREAFKEALRSRSRHPAVRHQALVGRARTCIAQDKYGLARKDLERVLAEDSDYEGLRALLDSLPVRA
jgi:hypothetical protein